MKKKLLSALLVYSVAFCLPCFGQWVHHNPGTVNYIADIEFVNDQIGYAPDDHTGKIWKTIDGANTWNLLNNNLFVGKLTFISPDTGFAITDSGLAKTINGGLVWNVVLIPTNVFWWHKPIFFNSTVGITVMENANGDSIIVYKTTDGGDNWFLFSQNAGYIGAILYDVSFPDSMHGFITGEVDAYKTSDGGFTWSLLKTSNYGIGSICFLNADTGFLVENMGYFYRTYNGGLDWDSVLPPVTPYNGKVRFLNSSLGYMCGGDGLTAGWVIKTYDGGSNWILDHGDNYTYTEFSFAENVGYACGGGGSVIKNSLLNKISESVNDFTIASPNPFTTKLNLHLSKLNGNVNVTVKNALGETLFQRTCSRGDEAIDLSELKTGLYLLTIDSPHNHFSEKIIKE